MQKPNASYAVDCLGHDFGIEPKEVVKKYIAPTGNVYVLTEDNRVWDVHPNICRNDTDWDDTVFGVRQQVDTLQFDYISGEHYALKYFGLMSQETFDELHAKYREYHNSNDTWNKEKLLGTL